MINLNKKLAAVVLGFFVILAGFTPASAQMNPTTTSTAPKPAPITMPVPGPVEDEIVQINNLRISDISIDGSNAKLSAVFDNSATTCAKFEGEKSKPCKMEVASFQHSISANGSTVLLQRDRKRISINEFAVGDKINVYGFREGSHIEALIMRNLDKPQKETFIQLNSVYVTSVSSPSVPATITAVRRDMYPCYDFGEKGNSKGLIMPCPLGMAVSASLKSGKAVAGSTSDMKSDVKPVPPGEKMLMPFIQYKIDISSKTSLVDKNKKPVSLASIANDHQLNVYGVLKSDGSIDARIIRDMSLPSSQPEKRLSITTESSLNAKVGEYFSAAFKVSGGDPSQGYNIEAHSDVPGLNWTRTAPCPEGMACIQVESKDMIYVYGKPMRAGKYNLTITANDNPHTIYCIKAPCPQPQRSFGKASFTLLVEGDGGGSTTQQLRVKSISGPSSLKVGEVGSWTVSVDGGSGNISYQIYWGDEYKRPMPPVATQPLYLESSGGFSHSYSFSGSFNPTFVVSDSSGQTVKASASVRVQ